MCVKSIPGSIGSGWFKSAHTTKCQDREGYVIFTISLSEAVT